MKFTETYIGQNAKLSHLITKRDVLNFFKVSGDFNKLHVDSAFAAKTEFKTPIVHGMLVASFISTVIGTQLPGHGALWKSQNMKFVGPARIGDVITVIVEVAYRNESQNEINLITDVYNQDGEVVILGTAIVKILE
jgi:3-oxoacyl-[acyl-carrier protein] reductase